MRYLEELAVRDWTEALRVERHLALAEDSVGMPGHTLARYAAEKVHEYVALGFELSDGMMLWYPLTNVAGPGEFLVDDAEVRSVLDAARSDADAIEEQIVRIVLWHSHYIATEPSISDMSNFPEWVDVGMVFHAPSETTTLYNAAGIIGQEPILISPRDTEVEEAHG